LKSNLLQLDLQVSKHLVYRLMDCKPVTPIGNGASASDNPALCTSGNRAAVAFRGKNNQVFYNIFRHNQNDVDDWGECEGL
jgi:hypothetical protein